MEPSSLRDYSPAAPIRRHQFNLNPIADQHANEVSVDAIGDMRHDEPAAILESYAVHRARQHVHHHTR
jgi:hypothetical protein